MEGFGPFANPEAIDFTDGLVYITGKNRDWPQHGESNGAGKTSVLNAISWALYGRTPAGSRKQDIIHHACQQAEVKLALEGLYIRRVMAKGSSEVLRFRSSDGIEMIGGGDTSGRLGDVQNLLEHSFGIDFDTFCNTLYLGQSSKTVQFLDAPPKDRAKLLSHLVDDRIFQQAADELKEELDDYENKIARLEGALEAVIDQVESLKDERIRIQHDISEVADRDRERRVRAKSRLATIRHSLAECEKVLAIDPEYTMEELEAKRVHTKKKLEALESKSSEWQHLAIHAQTLEEGDVCPTCRREVDEDAAIDLTNSIEEARELWEASEHQAARLQAKLDNIKKKQQQIRDLRDQKERARLKIKELRAEHQHLKDDLEDTDTGRFHRLLEEKTTQLKTLMARQTELNDELLKLKASAPRKKFVYKAFRNEITCFLFDKIREQLHAYTRKHLTLVSGDRYRVEYPPQSTTGKEKFEVDIYLNGISQSLSNFSSGEKWRVALAILLAFRTVLLDSRKMQAPWLLIDDPLGVLDKTGVEVFNTLLTSLVAEGIPQIIATVPRFDYRTSAHTQIEVTLRNGVSTIEVL